MINCLRLRFVSWRYHPGMPGPRVILLNGTSSAGKTTLARAVQDEADTPFVYWGIDTLFALVPQKWGGGLDGPLAQEGFRYERGQDPDGHLRTVIRVGPTGLRILHAGCAAAAAIPRSGLDLVIDEMLLTPDLLRVWLTALAGFTVQFVAVTCPPEVAEQREAARGQVPGLSRGHRPLVHAHEHTYDAVVDTAAASPADLAVAILRGEPGNGRLDPH
ncbi:chloramphenicol phosphotransferase CPT family protein [Nocardia harenae]|uniref:chloramphenicol phosphotransferase CPT family protein n=1 Tax=Nocardia harenae TaxID=358707 RepID=UPI000AE53C4F|nr:chloramphenicol phosphotransferase CPT family protein [Nocardia harenae]